jgi:hypothetical protein
MNSVGCMGEYVFLVGGTVLCQYGIVVCGGLGIEMGGDMWLAYECPNGDSSVVLEVESDGEDFDKEIKCPACGAVMHIKGDPGPIRVEEGA